MSVHRAFIVALFSIAALAHSAGVGARSLQQVLNSSNLRVGVSLDAPWTARTPSGELVGFEVDVARQLAADMGVAAEFLVYDFDRLVPALEAGEIDLIAAGLTVTPDRALHVNFSQPYADGGVSLATHLQSTLEIKRLEDLDDPAYTVAAVEGSVAVALARRLLPRAKLQVFGSADVASAALIAGEVHAYLEDEPIPTYLALENPTTVDVPMARPLLVSRAGFAVNKGDPDFLAFLNSWIVAREADTWLPTTATYWFKSLRWRQTLEAASER
jgi:polar amino acid transport system substrate-binding protein